MLNARLSLILKASFKYSKNELIFLSSSFCSLTQEKYDISSF